MSFSIKQLLGFVLVIGLGLAALANSDKPLIGSLSRLVVICALILAAYGIWISTAETRAFRIGFLCWGGLYFLLYVALNARNVDIGTSYLLGLLTDPLAPGMRVRNTQGTVTGIHGSWYDRFLAIGHCAFSLLAGVIGGWVTAYFYHRRQCMLKEIAKRDLA